MNNPNDGCVVSLSGGMDSATLLGEQVLKWGAGNIRAIAFNYGQRHSNELMHAQAVANFYSVEFDLIGLPNIFSGGKSSLMGDTDVEAIGTYKELADRHGSQPTVVPNRNMNFIAMMVTFALVQGKGHVVLGAHAGDANNFHYPDCRAAFNGAMAAAIEIATEGQISLEVPFNFMSKGDIVVRAAEIHAPLSLTMSCYKGLDPACGECATCHERVGAFIEAGYQDPIEYANGDALYQKAGISKHSLMYFPLPISPEYTQPDSFYEQKGLFPNEGNDQ